MTPQRIAYVVNVFPKLSETFIANELAQLRARGVELSVLSLREPTETLRHSLIEKWGLMKTVCYDPSEFTKRLHEFGPRLLHAHFATEPTAHAWGLAKDLGIPFTFTAHGYDIHRKAPDDFYDRAMAAARVITVSRANARFIEREFEVPRAKIEVIPCGVDTNLFKPGVGPAPGPPLIVCVARHVPVKNLQLLLQACAILRDRRLAFSCVMLGEGPCSADLEKLRQQLRLDQVQMPGAAEQNEVLGWWQKASIGVLTSQSEGFPVCLLEAGACGVPVVATRVGGISELVRNKETGFYVSPGDVHALADCLAELLSNRELRLRLGRAARRRVEGNFSIRQQVASLLNVWQEVLYHHDRR